MKIPTRDAIILAEALRALYAGDGRRFDDTLWLGLGDGCAAAYKMLVSGGFIEHENDIQAVKLTPRGRQLLLRLNETVLKVA